MLPCMLKLMDDVAPCMLKPTAPVQAGRPEAVNASLVQDIGQRWNVNPAVALVPELRHTYETMIEACMPPASQPLV